MGKGAEHPFNGGLQVRPKRRKIFNINTKIGHKSAHLPGHKLLAVVGDNNFRDTPIKDANPV